jgi:hypothetical protein
MNSTVHDGDKAAMSTTDTCPVRATGRRGWPVERVLFAMAGTVVLLSAALAAFVSPWFLLLAVFVGLNQWLYVLAGDCPASLILTRAFHLKRGLR